MHVIATALGADNAKKHYPDERYVPPKPLSPPIFPIPDSSPHPHTQSLLPLMAYSSDPVDVVSSPARRRIIESKVQRTDEGRYDIIWIFHHGQITEKRSMHCPGLDEGRVDEGDPDLIIEEFSGSIWETVRSVWRGMRPAV